MPRNLLPAGVQILLTADGTYKQLFILESLLGEVR
jgi:hypothetical protein